ncbi:MAG: ATP-binding cassette domain-containing protein [Clostridia bacterium]|nr:ATP-binding cassette domain-containing protein [Clostridia bacterium]
MLKLEKVSFKVDVDGKDLEIIDNVDIEVPDGAFTVITGPNGGGKSTLARLIMGIEKPTSGRILYNDIDITNLSVTERAKLGIGYAFQQPPRFKGLTVRRLLSLAAGNELPVDECCGYLTSVGLCSKDYLNREMDNSLSGGEAKRIEIATLMARKLGLAIFDEPEAGIDLWSFSMLVESFKAMSKGSHNSVIIISHQERIMQLADEMVIIADGKVRDKGPKERIFPQLMGEFNENCGFRGKEE